MAEIWLKSELVKLWIIVVLRYKTERIVTLAYIVENFVFKIMSLHALDNP